MRRASCRNCALRWCAPRAITIPTRSTGRSSGQSRPKFIQCSSSERVTCRPTLSVSGSTGKGTWVRNRVLKRSRTFYRQSGSVSTARGSSGSLRSDVSSPHPCSVSRSENGMGDCSALFCAARQRTDLDQGQLQNSNSNRIQFYLGGGPMVLFLCESPSLGGGSGRSCFTAHQLVRHSGGVYTGPRRPVQWAAAALSQVLFLFGSHPV